LVRRDVAEHGLEHAGAAHVRLEPERAVPVRASAGDLPSVPLEHDPDS